MKLILAAASEDEPTAVDLENERMEQAEPAAEPFPENGRIRRPEVRSRSRKTRNKKIC